MKDLEDWETFNRRKLKERENMLLDLHVVELTEKTEKVKKEE